MVLAALLNLVTGLIVDKFPVIYLVLISSALGAVGPLLMAINTPSWPYWYAAFPAQFFEPLSPDGEFSYGPIPRSLGVSLMAIFPSDIHCGYTSRFGSVSRPDTSACRRSFQYRCSVWSSHWTCSHRRRVGLGDTELEVRRQKLTWRALGWLPRWFLSVIFSDPSFPFSSRFEDRRPFPPPEIRFMTL